MRKGLAVFIFSTVFSLLFAELITRLFLPEVSDSFIIELQEVTNKFHHGRPSVSAPPRADAFRIMVLGDSFTAGWGVADRENDSYPAQMERKLAKDGCGTQVFNLGVSSYSPSTYGVVLDSFAPAIKPHLVVIAVDDGDFQDDYMLRDTLVLNEQGLPIAAYPKLYGVPQGLVGIARTSKFLRLACYVTYQHLHRTFESWRTEEDRYFGDIFYRFDHFKREEVDRWKPAVQHTFELLRAIIRYCKSRGIQVLLVNYPYAAMVTTEYGREPDSQFSLDRHTIYHPSLHALQAELAGELGISYYDLTPFVRGLADLNGFFAGGNDLHYGVHGYRLFAEQLAGVIEERFLGSRCDARRVESKSG